MEHVNLVFNTLLLEGWVVAVAVVMVVVGVGLIGIKFCNSGNDGQLLVW